MSQRHQTLARRVHAANVSQADWAGSGASAAGVGSVLQYHQTSLSVLEHDSAHVGVASRRAISHDPARPRRQRRQSASHPDDATFDIRDLDGGRDNAPARNRRGSSMASLTTSLERLGAALGQLSHAKANFLKNKFPEHTCENGSRRNV